MKLNPRQLIALAAAASVSTAAQQFTPTPDLSQPPDQKKISYALGMNLGLQIKRIGADVDVNVVAQALRDVLNGKPTQLQPSELRPIFKQEEDAQRVILSAKNKSQGLDFLAKNAREPGIMVMPDGLQYRVISAGVGESPKNGDGVILKYRGTLVDGTEFDHNDHFQGRIETQIKGWQEALHLMKPGSRWQLYLSPALAYGAAWKGIVGPESTVIFDMELVSILSPADAQEASGGGIIHSIPQSEPGK